MKRTDIKKIVRAALQEDKARQDITSTTLISASHMSQAKIFSKQHAVIAGLNLAKEVFLQLNPKTKVKLHKKDC